MKAPKKVTEEDVIEIARGAARLLDEKKADDVLLIDLSKINSYLDYFVIATANSHTHGRALAREAQRYFKGEGFSERSRADLDSPWIALDYHEVVIHIFTREMRKYYQLERLWADAASIDFR
ncbi:MAG TPA: ribosome silencing factor [Spirochaetota bacterium]|nr:ribosome silencing factor [Spirochaetota bacterium]